MRDDKELLVQLLAERKRVREHQNTLAAQSSRCDPLPIKMSTETYLRLTNLSVEALHSRLAKS